MLAYGVPSFAPMNMIFAAIFYSAYFIFLSPKRKFYNIKIKIKEKWNEWKKKLINYLENKNEMISILHTDEWGFIFVNDYGSLLILLPLSKSIDLSIF